MRLLNVSDTHCAGKNTIVGGFFLSKVRIDIRPTSSASGASPSHRPFWTPPEPLVVYTHERRRPHTERRRRFFATEAAGLAAAAHPKIE